MSSAAAPFLVLAHAARDRANGVVRCTRGKLLRLFCLRDGRVVWGRSNVREEQFVGSLVRAGRLTAAAAREIEQEGARSSSKPSAILRQRGFVPPSDLDRLFRVHLSELLAETLSWPDGTAAFEAGTPDLRDECTTDLELGPLLSASGWLRRQAAARLRVSLGRPDVQLRRSGDDGLPCGLPRSPEIDAVLGAAAVASSVSELTAQVAAGEDAGLRATVLLHALGALRVDEVGGAPESDSDLPSRMEIEGWLSRTRSGTLYDVLGIDASAAPDKIRAAYYRLARRLHPDRFRAGPLADLVGAVELFFARVTEAYNTLSDAERRARYDADLERRTLADRPRAGDAAGVARQNFLRGRALAERRKFTEAVSFLENAIALDDSQAEYFRVLGEVLSSNPRRRDDAESALRRATGLDPSDAQGWVALGNLLLRGQRRDEAARAFREALRWNESHAEAIERLSEL